MIWMDVNFSVLLVIAMAGLALNAAHGSTSISSAQSPPVQACEDVNFDELSGAVTLPSGCVFNRQIEITRSDVHLNCSGSFFDGRGKGWAGLRIDSRGRQLTNVVVENCGFRNFSSYGVIVGWLSEMPEEAPDREILYARTPRDVFIRHVTIENSARVGLYVGGYVRRLTLENSSVSESGGVGVYLDQASVENVISHNAIKNSGMKDGRESIAIDSSAFNRIEDNVIDSGKGGGIFLYKNCGENFGRKIPFKRWQESSHNTIRKNTISNTKVGVWVASRQSKNLRNWGCLDKPMDTEGKFYEDYANDNLIEGNKFCAVGVPVRVEGDRNVVRFNEFDTARSSGIDFPPTAREKMLGKPSFGNVEADNAFSACN